MFRNIPNHVPRETGTIATYSVGSQGLEVEVSKPLPDFMEFSLPNLRDAGLLTPVSTTVIHDSSVSSVADAVVDHFNNLNDKQDESQD